MIPYDIRVYTFGTYIHNNITDELLINRSMGYIVSIHYHALRRFLSNNNQQVSSYVALWQSGQLVVIIYGIGRKLITRSYAHHINMCMCVSIR